MFNTQSEREDLMRRNLQTSPFKNPTGVEGPAPDSYAIHNNPNKSSFIATTSDFGAKPAIPKDTTSSIFKSVAPRDPLGGVSQDMLHNPGPGTYLNPQMQLGKIDAQTRPQLSPFGTAQPRFEADRQSLAEQVRQLKQS